MSPATGIATQQTSARSVNEVHIARWKVGKCWNQTVTVSKDIKSALKNWFPLLGKSTKAKRVVTGSQENACNVVLPVPQSWVNITEKKLHTYSILQHPTAWQPACWNKSAWKADWRLRHRDRNHQKSFCTFLQVNLRPAGLQKIITKDWWCSDDKIPLKSVCVCVCVCMCVCLSVRLQDLWCGHWAFYIIFCIFRHLVQAVPGASRRHSMAVPAQVLMLKRKQRGESRCEKSSKSHPGNGACSCNYLCSKLPLFVKPFQATRDSLSFSFSFSLSLSLDVRVHQHPLAAHSCTSSVKTLWHLCQKNLWNSIQACQTVCHSGLHCCTRPAPCEMMALQDIKLNNACFPCAFPKCWFQCFRKFEMMRWSTIISQSLGKIWNMLLFSTVAQGQQK